MSDPAFIPSVAPSPASSEFDVAIVGASLAGCAAAMLFGRAGLRVALIERSREADDFKRLCTHFIQPSAVPTLRRLGIEDVLLDAGAVRNRIDMILPWGRTGEPPPVDYRGRSLVALNLRRSKLDPILRKAAAATPGVTMMQGVGVHDLLRSGERIIGVETRGRRSGPLRARLVVAADGRESAMAKLAEAPLRRSPNGRFGCFAQYRALELDRPATSLMWLDHALAAYLFPNDDEISVAACMPPKARLDEFRDDPEAALETLYATLPGAPRLDPARREGRALLVKDYPNQWREPVHQGMALIGDAAMSIDPLWGVGCGWAFQSAEWLVDATAGAVRDGGDLPSALAAYRKRHHRELDGHRFIINDFSRRERFNLIERLMFSAATRDERTGEHVAAFGARLIGPGEFLAPAAVMRAVGALFKPPRLPTAPA